MRTSHRLKSTERGSRINDSESRSTCFHHQTSRSRMKETRELSLSPLMRTTRSQNKQMEKSLLSYESNRAPTVKMDLESSTTSRHQTTSEIQHSKTLPPSILQEWKAVKLERRRKQSIRKVYKAQLQCISSNVKSPIEC